MCVCVLYRLYLTCFTSSSSFSCMSSMYICALSKASTCNVPYFREQTCKCSICIKQQTRQLQTASYTDTDKDTDTDTDTDTILCAHFITDTHQLWTWTFTGKSRMTKNNYVHPAASDRASREHRAGAIHSIGLPLSSVRRF